MHLIQKGEIILNALLPNESASKPVDLALLSLIYPLNIVTNDQATRILANVEAHLVRAKGIIRYPGDQYYNNGAEANWALGFPWLAIIYNQRSDHTKYNYYLNKTREAMNENSELPELYYAGTSIHNENSPLAWAQALYLVAAASES